jgi:5-methylthioadenosine/S-adenosylhomocysteine deaminase
MKTKITGKYVIGFNDNDHVIYLDGQVVYEGEEIIYVGQDYRESVDATIHAGNAIISPGFIDLDALGDIDHAILDCWVPTDIAAGLNWSDEYFREGRKDVFNREEEMFKRRYALVQLINNGITTAMPITWEVCKKNWTETYEETVDLAEIATDLGLRVYLGPSYRSGIILTHSDGVQDVIWDEQMGVDGLRKNVEFIEKFDGTHDGLIKGFLAPCTPDTSTPDLLRQTKRFSDELNCPIRLHAAEVSSEVENTRRQHNKTPMGFLKDLGFLGPRTLIPHAIYIADHPLLNNLGAGEEELVWLRESQTSVIHCPYVIARYGAALNSFDRYKRAGINLCMGTDTFLPDMIRNMAYGSNMSRIVEGRKEAGTAADLFRAATLGGAKALGRDDLGKLTSGAKADIIIIDLNGLHVGPLDDPIRSMLANTTGRDVRTVIINGRIVMQDWRIPGVDSNELRNGAQKYFDKMKGAYTERDFLKRPVETLFPPSFRVVSHY